MQTPIEKLIENFNANIEGIQNVLDSDEFSKYDKERWLDKQKAIQDIVMTLEVEYLHIEKRDLLAAYDFGYQQIPNKTSEDFYKEMYS
ncbi:MAG: hypothetical protein RL308_3085 [Bacteroidota bacterium]|jgi:hypothetical protein|uniref:Uncharacterized protein n=1 Tax=Flavobacterium psychrophilum TaxID=96345 RepID=A0A7U2NGV1_FLAPS|nr:hypothetical protein [Flavobacterium psychrophilum]QRE03480.1 hypothetical protein H0H26_11405 [Flavobacterium psychrophilum]QRE04900.1 hypothetical protein H0H26_04740 [Flavobacterium psychrophilum]QRE04916.1 hypothetical protein H0H26_04820 [Flavobacterium psychrophilum]